MVLSHTTCLVVLTPRLLKAVSLDLFHIKPWRSSYVAWSKPIAGFDDSGSVILAWLNSAKAQKPVLATFSQLIRIFMPIIYSSISGLTSGLQGSVHTYTSKMFNLLCILLCVLSMIKSQIANIHYMQLIGSLIILIMLIISCFSMSSSWNTK